MRIAVCIKQVPNSEARLRVRPDGAWIEEDDLVINEGDTFALEAAIAIAEESGGEVVVITVGGPKASEALRKALAMGAHRAVHLVDEAFQGGDASSTARALAAVIGREEPQLVLTGSQTDDVGHGATATVLAGHLGWPHAWLVMGIEVEEGGSTLRVIREMEGGVNEILRVATPAVIEVQAGINHPRYATLKGIMQSKKKPVDTPTPTDLGLDPSQIGAAGAAVEIVSVALPDSGTVAQMIEGDAEAAAAALVDKLRNEARVL